MKKNIFKRPFQCSLQTTIMSPSDYDKSNHFCQSKPSIEQVVKENIQLLQKPEDLPEEKILYEAPSELINSDNDEPPPPIPCQNLIKKLRKDKKTKKEVSFDNNSTKEVSNDKFLKFVGDNTTVSDDDLTKMIRLVKRMKKLKV